jgi:transposase-like protein
LDALIGDTATPEELGALFRRLQKRLAERILAGELTNHLGCAAREAKPAAVARGHRRRQGLQLWDDAPLAHPAPHPCGDPDAE